MSPAQQITLVRLVPDDWQLWRGLRLQALAEAPHAFGSTLRDWQGLGDAEARWRNRLASVPLNLLASVHGGFVGMVSATGKDESGMVEVISLWVAPTERGHGVGDRLVEAVIAWAKQQHASCVALDVKADNERAKALYLRHGFTDVGPSSTDEFVIDIPERRLLCICSTIEER